MKTAIVILNWNGRKFLEKFLPGLLASVGEAASGASRTGRDTKTQPEREVIIADNASTDDSLEWLRKNHPEVRTIVFDKNYGYTGGYNRALAQIKAEYFLLLNSDIEVTDGWLDPLEEWMDNHILCGACSPKLRSYSDRDMFEYAGAAGGCLDKYGYPFCRGRVLKWVEKDFGQYDEPQNVFWASGACLMVRADLFLRLGGLDERFFAHQEEIDLCWRMQLDGYVVTVVPESMVYHVGGGTLPNDSPWKLELNYRNNLLMLDNNLAKTSALHYFNTNYIESEGAVLKGNVDPEEAAAAKAAKHGCRKAKMRIFMRMVLDGCSAIAYLLTLRPKFFTSVVKAHRQYRCLRHGSDREEIRSYLLEKGKIAGVRGYYSRWIVPQALLRRKDVFNYIKSKNLNN